MYDSIRWTVKRIFPQMKTERILLVAQAALVVVGAALLARGVATGQRACLYASPVVITASLLPAIYSVYLNRRRRA